MRTASALRRGLLLTVAYMGEAAAVPVGVLLLAGAALLGAR